MKRRNKKVTDKHPFMCLLKLLALPYHGKWNLRTIEQQVKKIKLPKKAKFAINDITN